MTEETEANIPARPAKKRQKRKLASRAAAPPAAKADSPFAGITSMECCDGCHKDGCVISGMNYCAHPFKGGLQAAQMNDQAALKRFNRAKAVLKDQMIDLRNR
jgi:hypothetical protein